MTLRVPFDSISRSETNGMESMLMSVFQLMETTHFSLINHSIMLGGLL